MQLGRNWGLKERLLWLNMCIMIFSGSKLVRSLWISLLSRKRIPKMRIIRRKIIKSRVKSKGRRRAKNRKKNKRNSNKNNIRKNRRLKEISKHKR